MPRRLPPFVECWRDRHGKVRTYFRKNRGPRIPLPADIGSAEFNAAYQAALAGQTTLNRGRWEAAKQGTIGALIVSYLRSPGYQGLRETTKKGYTSRIEVLRNHHGHRSLAGMTRERIITGILQPYAKKPGAALSILKMLRVLIRHAIEIGWLKHDPSVGIKRPKTKEIRSWTDTEIAVFEKHWRLAQSSGLDSRLCFTLANVGVTCTA